MDFGRRKGGKWRGILFSFETLCFRHGSDGKVWPKAVFHRLATAKYHQKSTAGKGILITVSLACLLEDSIEIIF